MKRCLFVSLLIAACVPAFSQLLVDSEEAPSRADTLRGTLSSARACYDVKDYDLTVKVHIDSQSIEGVVLITFRAVDDFEQMQVDLFWNMNIGSMTLDDALVTYRREYNAVFVNTGLVKKGSKHVLKIEYSGKPQVAKMPPWDGGFVWSKDAEGNAWIGVACEGTGASLWWPNKDHLSDEPETAQIHLIVPDTLVAVSNGRTKAAKLLDNGWKQYDWTVSYPINNYNITLNIGKYKLFTDQYTGSDNSKLSLDYYVLDYNLEKAKKHFEQVKPMMKCYEKYFGPFPFIRDGFKLVETPYLGMEHQSAIAYGNSYMKGYAGIDFSRIGLDFDYIIIHEAGHEWWGNAISCKDIADLWIHEGFCTYGEALYVECIHGYDTAIAYINAKKFGVENSEPIIGSYHINREGSNDMYNKGCLLLHTLRNVIANDSLWFSIIRGILKEYSYKTTTSEEVENYISKRAGMDLKYFFNQYLRKSKIPVFEYKLKKGALDYRWVADVSDFKMPLRVSVKLKNKIESPLKLTPTTEWQQMKLAKKAQIRVANDLFYIITEKVK